MHPRKVTFGTHSKGEYNPRYRTFRVGSCWDKPKSMRYCSKVDEVLLGQAKVDEEWWREAKVDEVWWQEAKVDEVLPGQVKVDQVITWLPRPGQSRNNGEAVALG